MTRWGNDEWEDRLESSISCGLIVVFLIVALVAGAILVAVNL